MERRRSELVKLLPTNCYSTVCKLRKMTTFVDVDKTMGDTLSECDDARVINNQLLSYIIDKCAGNALLLCDVLKNVVSIDKIKQLQDLGTYTYMYMHVLCTVQLNLRVRIEFLKILRVCRCLHGKFVSAACTFMAVITTSDSKLHDTSILG